MSTLITILLTAAAVLGGLMLIQLLMVLVRMLQFPIRALRIVPLAAPPVLPLHRAAAIAELEALGFGDAHWSEVRTEARTVPAVLLRHADGRSFAELTFTLGGNLGGYAVAFHSFLADGTVLTTGNRMDWLRPLRELGVELADPYADDIAGHWQAHEARLSGREVTTPDVADAQARIAAFNESAFDRLRDAGAIRQHGAQWHYTLRSALRITLGWFRVRRKLARPYHSAANDGNHAGGFFSDCYLEMEWAKEQRASRHDVKVWVLALSAAVSLAGWGLAFDWSEAFAVVAIILVHESGHALAMRAFGYRQMHMFFVPFIGAIVTGATRELPAWKQAIVLLAGPVPGLIAGVAALLWLDPGRAFGMDWHTVAVMAVWINLFNLLPITPLDGGQLTELALFSRSPIARLVFAAVSVLLFAALALMVEGPFVWALTFLVALSMVGQWRVARLQRAWRDGIEREPQIANLYEAARDRLRIRGFHRLYAAVHSVFALSTIRPPRLWERALVLTAVAGLWFVVVMTVLEWPLPVQRTERGPETRTAQQIAFDRSYWDYTDGEGPDAAGLAELEEAARGLDAADPRQVDLAVERAQLGTDYFPQLEKLIGGGRDGQFHPRQEMAQTLLRAEIERQADKPPAARAKALQTAVDHLLQLSPAAFPGTVDAELRIAEAIDQTGGTAQAEAALARLAGATDGKWEHQAVVDAQAWFLLSHQRPDEAIALIERSVDREQLRYAFASPARTYAWALLEAGRKEEAVAQMRIATYPSLYRKPTLFERLVDSGGDSFPIEAGDLVYALRVTGREQEARALLQNSSWECWSTETDQPRSMFDGPWHDRRDRAVQESLRALCPPRKGCSQEGQQEQKP